jgi:cytochrome b
MNKTNLAIDFGIFAAFLIAMEPNLTGVSIHEWLSVALAATIIVHLLMHWKWIISVGKTFFVKLFHSSRLKFFVDVLLFLDFTLLMLSGLLISRAVLPALGLGISGGFAWRSLHSLAANVGMALVAVHFALSWKWIVCTVKRYILAPIGRMFTHTKPQQPAPVTIASDEH